MARASIPGGVGQLAVGQGHQFVQARTGLDGEIKGANILLDDGEINVWNLCTQHAKAAMRRQTGQRVMAEDLGHAVKRERKQIALALEYYRAGWHDALKSEEALY